MRRTLPVALVALLAGCTVGPNYSGPRVAGAGTPPGFVRAGDAPVVPQPPVARWWTALGDPTLSALEARALAANPDLAAAEPRIRQARAGLREQKADLLPNGSASALYAHARIPGLDLDQLSTGPGDGGQARPGGGSVSSLNLYNVGFDASWEVDLFGGQRRAVEAARATVGGAEAILPMRRSASPPRSRRPMSTSATGSAGSRSTSARPRCTRRCSR